MSKQRTSQSALVGFLFLVLNMFLLLIYFPEILESLIQSAIQYIQSEANETKSGIAAELRATFFGTILAVTIASTSLALGHVFSRIGTNMSYFSLDTFAKQINENWAWFEDFSSRFLPQEKRAVERITNWWTAGLSRPRPPRKKRLRWFFSTLVDRDFFQKNSALHQVETRMFFRIFATQGSIPEPLADSSGHYAIGRTLSATFLMSALLWICLAPTINIFTDANVPFVLLFFPWLIPVALFLAALFLCMPLQDRFYRMIFSMAFESYRKEEAIVAIE